LQNGRIPERFPTLPLPQPFPSAEWHGRAYHFLINKATTSNYIHFFIRRQPEPWHPRMTKALILLPFTLRVHGNARAGIPYPPRFRSLKGRNDPQAQ
jgi:hypothetical protein